MVAAFAAANLYYSQPLLPGIAADLGVTVGHIGLLQAFTQIGFAFGIFAALPLADMLERRLLICTMLTLSACALIVQASAPNATVAFTAALFVGFFGVSPQLITPFAAVLAPKGREGAAVGLVLSCILSGILVSKLIAGFVGGIVGWRSLYRAAAVVTLGLALVLRARLPESRPKIRQSYAVLLRSTLTIAREEPELRRYALFGALTFSSFMTFWSTYAINLQDIFGFGPEIAGLFGIAGIAGALGASIAGRQIDSGRFEYVSMSAAILMILGFVVLALDNHSVVWMVIGILLMDFGAGLSHAANQSSAFALRPEARGRINGVYMGSYFIGGALGTAIATLTYSTGGWTSTCAFGGACALAILVMDIVHLALRRPRLVTDADPPDVSVR